MDLDLNSPESIKQVSKDISVEMMDYYTGYRPGDVPGNLPDPYFWWVAGAMFGALIDYWYYTGDDQYNDKITQALLHQVGPNADFLPPNQTKTAGNDDQAFWALAAMTAAEYNFPNPPDDQPQWLALVQAVFNGQAMRWDETACGGGLKWQIFTFNRGYNYKNTISNGCFFQMAARLAKYTGNTTYLEWAEKSWEWTETVGLVAPNYQFFDGTDDLLNCSEFNRIQWSYNAGVHLFGAAMLWNLTESEIWRERTDGILKGTETFFSQEVPNVMFEVACERTNTCNVDQRSFKGFLARWMAGTALVAPWTADYIKPRLEASAKAAAAQCSGGESGKKCGLRWTRGAEWDGDQGVCEQMAAMEVVQSNLYETVPGPLSKLTGGTSKGDPAAGTNSAGTAPVRVGEITTADRVGAGFLTTAVLVTIVGGSWWMVS